MENRAPESEDEIDRLMRAGHRGDLQKGLDEMTSTPEFQQAMDRLAELAKTDPDAAELLKLEQGLVKDAQKRMARREVRKELGRKIRRFFGR